MKYKFLLLAATLISTLSFSQAPYWQQELKYKIKVALNDQLHSVSGNVELDYINHSPDTLNFIWFHIWPNAYRSDSTALGKQISAEKTKPMISDRGFIDSLNFNSGGTVLKTEADSANIDIVKVLLPQPLLPGAQVSIATPFHVKLPSYFSRSGYDGTEYILCQWYPKPAVYDSRGWHPMPYLDHGEFYSEFGNFEVEISLPSTYIVGATGVLQDKDEFETYKTLGGTNEKKSANAYKKFAKRKGDKTLKFTAENVHDFAWFADKNFTVKYDTLSLDSNKNINVFSYYHAGGNKQWENSISFIKDAVRHYSKWIGEYPYPTVAAVEGPKNFSSGGMEYPMITLITSPDATKESLDGVITHEVGHNWFYGILATNERDHPWMDEGINTFYQFRYEAEKYRSNSVFGSSIPKNLKSLGADEFLDRIYYGLNTIPTKQPVETASQNFDNKDDYGLVVYVKTAVWMSVLEDVLGKEAFEKGMQEYFKQWKFKHPYPDDLQQVLEKTSGKDLGDIFLLLTKKGNF